MVYMRPYQPLILFETTFSSQAWGHMVRGPLLDDDFLWRVCKVYFIKISEKVDLGLHIIMVLR
jgi:hypothetical protein